MPIYKDYGDLKIHRWWCDCHSPSHVLELIEEHEIEEVNDPTLTLCLTSRGDEQPWYYRLKEGLKYIFSGDRICYMDVILCADDIKELGTIILKAANVKKNKKKTKETSS